MIKKLEISNFKPFLHTSCDLSPLTYILGENGIGKSSISQALLLAKQSIDSSNNIEKISLNGSYTRIGNGVDALCRHAETETIGLKILFEEDKTLSINAEYVSDRDILLAEVVDDGGLAELCHMPIGYLSANRVGPQLLSQFSRSDLELRSIDDKGINALALLYEHGDLVLPENDARIPTGTSTRNISHLFDHYLSEISSGASLALNGLTNIDSVSSTYSFSREGALPLSNIRPTNVGFGLSYVSSVIVACLLAKPGTLLIFENPEAHLHTKGQRAIADLMARTASSGSQIICETHSRELLYFTRKQIRDGIVKPDLVNVAYVCDHEGKRQTNHWHPLTKPFSELHPSFESFLDYFGAPTDFLASA